MRVSPPVLASDFHCAERPQRVVILRGRKKISLPCAMQRLQLRAGLARLAGIADRPDTARAAADQGAEPAVPPRCDARKLFW
jgi:hypothetical protein